MPEPLHLFILAGEASGDRIGADLVRRLRPRTGLQLSGVGGTELESVGLQSLFPMHELSVMGWADVLPRLPRLLWRARQVAQAIIRNRPDVVVLVDAQVFSAIVARQVRAAGVRTPILLYVSPAVWAWKPERAGKLRGLFDEVLSVLPFEPQVMAELGGPLTHYVGHPALARLPLRPAVPESGPVLLLPGSREGELRRHLPLMRALADRLAGHDRVTGFLLPTPAHLQPRLAAAVVGWEVPVQVISNEPDRLTAFTGSIAACAVTGTVALELALAGVPMITTYVADEGQAKRWVKYKVKFAALPNAILDRPLVPEILGTSLSVEELAPPLAGLLDEPEAAARQLDGFRSIRQLMEAGAPEAPIEDPAARVLHWAQRSASGR
ncbi:MAG TPA: lipid-A-disaccharide synthase [Devosiaceae bacterium]|jgi:lipid-A-disaccharide synthase|nr:lipid-A-disaccharide synthase [Devosiaceae bacterium]